MASKAFCPFGTKVFFDGYELKEVRSIRFVSLGIMVELNFVPTDPAQRVVMRAIQGEKQHRLSIWLSDSIGSRAESWGIVTGRAVMNPDSVATLYFLIRGSIDFLPAAPQPIDDQIETIRSFCEQRSGQ